MIRAEIRDKMALHSHSRHGHSNVHGGALPSHVQPLSCPTLGLHWIIKLEEASYKHSLLIYKPCFAVGLPGRQSFTTLSTTAPSRQRHSHFPFSLWQLFLSSLKSKFVYKPHTITLITQSAHRERSTKGSKGSLHAVMPTSTSKFRADLGHLPAMCNF